MNAWLAAIQQFRRSTTVEEIALRPNCGCSIGLVGNIFVVGCRRCAGARRLIVAETSEMAKHLPSNRMVSTSVPWNERTRDSCIKILVHYHSSQRTRTMSQAGLYKIGSFLGGRHTSRHPVSARSIGLWLGRYRRSKRLPLGLRMNFSKSGAGWSSGFHGFRNGRNSKGCITGTVSILGTQKVVCDKVFRGRDSVLGGRRTIRK